MSGKGDYHMKGGLKGNFVDGIKRSEYSKWGPGGEILLPEERYGVNN